MANITRIKAGDYPRKSPAEPHKNTSGPSPDPDHTHKTSQKNPNNTAKTAKPSTSTLIETLSDDRTSKKTKKAKKSPKTKSPKTKKTKKPTSKLVRILTLPLKPFAALGRYIAASWRELRQVRWTNRKTTWKMVFAVFVYTAILMTIIVLLDALFTFIFNNLLG